MLKTIARTPRLDSLKRVPVDARAPRLALLLALALLCMLSARALSALRDEPNTLPQAGAHPAAAHALAEVQAQPPVSRVDKPFASTGTTGGPVAAAATFCGSSSAKKYDFTLSGPAESPPNSSPGTGTGYVVLDMGAQTMRVSVSFSGLTSNTSAAHIHSATAVAYQSTAGVATTTPSFNGFPSGVNSGTYSTTLDMTSSTSYNPSYVTANGGTIAAAFAALCAGIDAGKAYFNIHTSMYPGGEIRGFLVAAITPRQYLPLVRR